MFTPPTEVRTEGITDRDNSLTVRWNNAVTTSPQLSGYTVTLVWTRPAVFHNQPGTLSNTEKEDFKFNQNNNVYTHTFYGILPYSHNCITVEAVYSYNDLILGTSAAPTQCFNSSSSGVYYILRIQIILKLSICQLYISNHIRIMKCVQLYKFVHEIVAMPLPTHALVLCY